MQDNLVFLDMHIAKMVPTNLNQALPESLTFIQSFIFHYLFISIINKYCTTRILEVKFTYLNVASDQFD